MVGGSSSPTHTAFAPLKGKKGQVLHTLKLKGWILIKAVLPECKEESEIGPHHPMRLFQLVRAKKDEKKYSRAWDSNPELRPPWRHGLFSRVFLAVLTITPARGICYYVRLNLNDKGWFEVGRRGASWGLCGFRRCVNPASDSIRQCQTASLISFRP